MSTDCKLNLSPPKLTDVQSALLQLNAAAMVRFVVHSQRHQADLLLKFYRWKLFSTVRKIFQSYYWNIVWNWLSIGIHFVLFCICIFILVRNGRPTQWFILAAAFVMFVLSTADISITFRLMTHDIGAVILNPGGPDARYPVLKRLYEKDIIFVSNKSVLSLFSTIFI